MRWIAVGLLLMLAAPLAAGELTAAYAFDAKKAAFAAPTAETLAARIRAWASGCRITPGGALYVLDCPPPPETASDEEVRFEADATAVLLRDLDETVYVSACPSLASVRKLREQPAGDKETDKVARPAPDDRRDCEDLAAGQTYPAEVFEREIRLVTRGRRFALTLYRREPKPRTSRTPYELPPTRAALGPAGPDTARVYEPLPTPKVTWTPAEEPAARAGTRQARRALRDPGPAETDLRSGLLELECPGSAEARVFVDGVYLGRAPLRAPLVAGRHEIVVRKDGAQAEAHEAHVAAGETVVLKACR